MPFLPDEKLPAKPSQLEAPPARGHATKCPVPPGAPCLLFLRSSSIESLVLVSAPPVCRAVAWPAWLAELRAPKEDVRVRVEASRSDFLPYDAPRDALRGEYVIQEILISDLWCPCIGQLTDEDLHPFTDLPIGPEDDRVHLT